MKNQEVQRVRASTKFIRMFTSVIVLLGVCLSVEAKKFDEADCKPRLTVVAVSNDYKLKPYHIVLNQCSGTFGKTSPTRKTCAMLEEHEVIVDVVDEHGTPETRRLKNHTKCGAACTTSCGDNMIMDNECQCQCLGDECSKAATRKDDKTPPLQLPYLVGMALVGLFAVFVLAFDAMLCVKNKKGFMDTVFKCSCCGRADDNEHQSGYYTTTEL